MGGRGGTSIERRHKWGQVDENRNEPNQKHSGEQRKNSMTVGRGTATAQGKRGGENNSDEQRSVQRNRRLRWREK